jgi:ligand-binding SRPBCC domain-containing protein
MTTKLDDKTASRTKVFVQRSVIPGTAAQLWDFHAQPNAFSKLTPPPIFIQVLKNDLQSHEPGPTPTSFRDRMLRGPLAVWEHEHIFSDVPGGVELLDRVTLAHRPGLVGLVTRLLFDGLPLRLFFLYRHLRTRWALGGMQ